MERLKSHTKQPCLQTTGDQLMISMSCAYHVIIVMVLLFIYLVPQCCRAVHKKQVHKKDMGKEGGGQWSGGKEDS